MLKYAKTYIGLQEVPDEVSLVVEISNCPFNCKGCKNPELRTDVGEYLDDNALNILLDSIDEDVTCICFKGGDIEPYEVNRLAAHIRKYYSHLHIAWYSGDVGPGIFFEYHNFDYVKFGHYNKKLGDITSPTTNQRLYKVEGYNLHNITKRMFK